MKRFFCRTPCDFVFTFFVSHQTAFSVTYNQYTVWYFRIKSWYDSKNRCMIVYTVCFKWNLSSQERLPLMRSIRKSNKVEHNKEKKKKLLSALYQCKKIYQPISNAFLPILDALSWQVADTLARNDSIKTLKAPS